MKIENASVLALHDIIENLSASLWVMDREAIETSSLDMGQAQRALDDMKRLRAFINLQSIMTKLAEPVTPGVERTEAEVFRGFQDNAR